MDLAVGDARRTVCGDLADDVGLAVVDDRVHGVEAQPVEMKFLEPIERVVHQEIAHRPAFAVEIDRGAPRGVMALGEEVGRDRRQVITLGSEMVVDDVEQDREAARVAGLDQRLQIVGPAIARGGREQLHAVIAPVAVARETRAIGISSIAVTPSSTRSSRCAIAPAKSPVRGERAEMQLVDDDLFPRPAAPAGVGPAIGAGVDDLAGAVHAIGLKARGRVGKAFAVDPIAIARARQPRVAVVSENQPPGSRLHRQRRRAPGAVEQHRHDSGARGAHSRKRTPSRSGSAPKGSS